MKKRFSLFLALSLVCAILMAIPVEAAKGERGYEPAQATSFRREAETARLNNECSHTYTVTSTNRLSHKMTCSKCGYSYTQNHVFKYQSISASQHKKYCTVCDFSYTYAHDLSCTSISDTKHTTKCSQCAYTKTEKHSKTCVFNKAEHVEKCTKCNYTGPEEHHNYKCKKVDSTRHKYTCTKCSYNYIEGHLYTPIYGIIFSDLIIHEYCPICKSFVD